MPSSEFSEWMAFAALEPFGENRADLRAGIVASTLANIHRKKGAKAFAPTDFMPFGHELPAPTGDDPAAFEALLGSLGLRVVES